MVLVAAKATESGSSFWPTALGAMVGGAVSLLTTLVVERQKRKAVDDAEERRVLASAKLAARVIALELQDTESVLRVSLKQSPFKWPPTDGYVISTAAWSEHAGELGSLLPTDQWDKVAAVYSTYTYSNLFGDLKEEPAKELLQETKASVVALDAWRQSAKFKRP